MGSFGRESFKAGCLACCKDLKQHEIQKRSNKMNRNMLEGKWRQLRGSVREKWGDLTDDELDQIAGNSDRLSGILQERYGYTQMEAERQIDEFLENTEETDFTD
jgi:uncharacterized protein YjbJ (UPF0337 family)